MDGQLFLLWMRHKMLLCDPTQAAFFQVVFISRTRRLLLYTAVAVHCIVHCRPRVRALPCLQIIPFFRTTNTTSVAQAPTSIVPSLRTCVVKIIKIK